ncbi:MAG TPA: hypothetical protein VGG06_28050 [Thermoanaerobaculia bacterium]|jgi:hypothetical protein
MTRRHSNRKPRRPPTAGRFLAAAAVLALGACAEPPAESPELETVDVAPALEVDTSEDVKSRVRAPELVGILPGDFPPDLPLYLPASLIDFEPTASGRPTVSLLTPDGVSTVRRELLARLRQAGWSVSSGDDGAVALRKDGRRAWLRFEDSRPGTVYRFEYVP